MEILVNQESLNYSLESEESLGEVIDGLARWLHDGNFTITAIDVDDESLPIHDRSRWQDLDVHRVGRLSIEAFPQVQVQQTTLAAVRDYCALLSSALSEQNREILGELAQELPYVRQRLHDFFPSLHAPGETSPEGSALLVDSRLDDGALPDPAATARITEQLGRIVTLVESRIREYEDPIRELGLTLGQLVASSSALEDVPVQLQTGDDSAAMGTVLRFTELLSRTIRLLPLVKGRRIDTGPTPLGGGDIDTEFIGRFALDLTPHLQQLQEAFEIQDAVLIGDLLEYEIAPRLHELSAVLSATTASSADDLPEESRSE